MLQRYEKQSGDFCLEIMFAFVLNFCYIIPHWISENNVPFRNIRNFFSGPDIHFNCPSVLHHDHTHV